MKDYKNNAGMLYNLSKPEIDKEEGYAVFQAKSYANYKKTETNTSFGVVGFDKDGKPRYGMVTSTRTYHESYIQTNNIYVRATDKQLDDIEKNPEIAYAVSVEAVRILS
mgnify:CR=1 FL=1